MILINNRCPFNNKISERFVKIPVQIEFLNE